MGSETNLKWSPLLITLAFCLSFLITHSLWAVTWDSLMGYEEKASSQVKLDSVALLKKSQISYRTQSTGSFEKSFGVIISCVKGKISILKSLRDPLLPLKSREIREVGHLDEKTYLDLWDSLLVRNFWTLEDAPSLREDEISNTSIEFIAMVGNQIHKFQSEALYREEAQPYQTLQRIIDKTVHMQSLWNTYQTLVKGNALPN